MFWDSSAVVPFLVTEDWSSEGTSLLSGDPRPVIWWATPVECMSALERRRREGVLPVAGYEFGRRRLHDLLASVDVVAPHAAVREEAMQLLGAHPLRAADALQLAAAETCRRAGADVTSFVCLDDRLRLAATQEGFDVLPERAL